MKKLLGLALFVGLSAGASAQATVYHQLPDPSYKLVRLGNQWVIQDASGFFVGYYAPEPPPNTYVPPVRQPVVAQSQSFSSRESGYGSYGYGSYGYGSYGYSPYGFSNYGNFGNYGHCPSSHQASPCHDSQPVRQPDPEVRVFIPVH